MNQGYQREHKEEMPVLAICYDFDKTLSPNDMQAQGYIQSVGYDIGEFWKESNVLAQENDMDQNLAYMLKMKEEAEGHFDFTKEKLRQYGKTVQLFPGVRDWFRRIRDYGRQHNVIVEHYIISSGLKEMIEGTEVAGEFKKIYASAFYYDPAGVAVWPAQVINYTNKTQFLFRIEKGVLDVNDDGVNEYFAPDQIRVPFRNMIYIGDSDTDIPCMKLVNMNGGHSIAVYNAKVRNKEKVYRMMREGRIRYFAPADYTEGAELDRLVKTVIDRTETNEKLENIYYRCMNENLAEDRKIDEVVMRKHNLIMALETSRSFASTHSTVAELKKYDCWSEEDLERLFTIAVENGQVKSILTDKDIREFYQRLLDFQEEPTLASSQIRELLDL